MKVYIGIDWSENKHDVCFLDETGEVLLVKQIAHTIAGFRQLDQARQSLGMGRQEVIIGLETAHNLLVDYLWDQGYEQIYVLPPAAVKSAQKRYRQSGAKDDRWDAHLIANLLRTDQHCYIPWQSDQPLTRQIRAEVRLAQQLGQEAVRDGNRLRSLVLRYYPAALDAFPHLDSVVFLAFLQMYPTLSQAQALSFEQLKIFLREPANVPLLAALAGGSAIALTFSEPRTHRSIQVKADRAKQVELEADDLALIARQVAIFESELVFVNYTPRFAAYYCAYRDEEVVALELSPRNAFVQTPGPGAGEQLG